MLRVQAEGHGAYLATKGERGPFADDTGYLIRYVRGTPAGAEPARVQSSERLKGAAAWEALEATPYRVVPIWPLFREMYEADRAKLRARSRFYAKPFGPELGPLEGERGPRESSKALVFGALRGEKGARDAAHFPWGEGDWADYARFIDPVRSLVNQERPTCRCRHKPVSCAYLFNPYLQTLLTARLPGSHDAFPLGDFPWLWQRHRICAEAPRASRAVEPARCP